MEANINIKDVFGNELKNGDFITYSSLNTSNACQRIARIRGVSLTTRGRVLVHVEFAHKRWDHYYADDKGIILKGWRRGASKLDRVEEILFLYRVGITANRSFIKLNYNDFPENYKKVFDNVEILVSTKNY